MSSLKLHQILALHKQAFSDGESALTKLLRAMDKSALLAGVSKTYTPKDEDGQQLPSEGVRLQLRVPTLMAEVAPTLIRQFDLTAMVDAGNQTARADVVVDGVTVLEAVPVETLLFLEKKLLTLSQVIERLPVLDEADEWEQADDQLSFKTKPSYRVKTDKIPRPFVKAPATDKHPAQVEVVFSDEVVGTWSTIKFSGAIKASRKSELMYKVEQLRSAVKVARGEANSVVVEDKKIGLAVINFLGWDK